MEHIICIVVKIKNFPFFQIFLRSNKNLSLLFLIVVFWNLFRLLCSILLLVWLLTITYPGFLLFKFILKIILELVIRDFFSFIMFFFHFLLIFRNNFRNGNLLNFSSISFNFHNFGVCLYLFKLPHDRQQWDTYYNKLINQRSIYLINIEYIN